MYFKKELQKEKEKSVLTENLIETNTKKLNELGTEICVLLQNLSFQQKEQTDLSKNTDLTVDVQNESVDSKKQTLQNTFLEHLEKNNQLHLSSNRLCIDIKTQESKILKNSQIMGVDNFVSIDQNKFKGELKRKNLIE